MASETPTSIEIIETEPINDASPLARLTRPNRREFLGLALTAATGAVLWPLFPRVADAQVAGALCAAQTGLDLVAPGEIRSINNVLQGVINLHVETRSITYYNNAIYRCDEHQLRTYEGFQGFNVDPKNRVTRVGVASPGPTLRAAVGDTIQLIFLNRITPSSFNNTSVTSSFGKCDTTMSLSGTGPTGKPYPGNDASNFPNCFHASNTSNLHFHGTHVSPRGFGDNVLVGVVPNTAITPADAIKRCSDAYAAWTRGEDPTKALQEQAGITLQALLEAAQKAGNDNAVAELQAAVHANHIDESAGEWPQYWPGYYPNHFQLPVYTGGPSSPKMGQSPGTHWYHCHQHGSTTLQLLNGMAGLFIITGDYDDRILRLGGGTPQNPKIKEQIMILQLFAEQPNQVNNNPSAGTVAVNGQVLPTLRMKKGEVQWWRIANAAMKAHGIERYLLIDDVTYQKLVADPTLLVKGKPPVIDASTVPSMNRTAQDGVQYDWPNYKRESDLTTFELAPGNRGDFLVKAPAAAGTSYLVFWPPAGTGTFNDIRANTIFKVLVAGDPAGENTQLPTESEYPDLPPFLTDITDEEVNGKHRTITFSMTGGIGTQPRFFIDNRQFTEGTIDQLMLMGTAEEWTLRNTSLNSIMHPFHIHVNPFQVVEVYDPVLMSAPQPQPAPWVWGDTMAIPAGVQQTDENGKPKVDAKGNPVITAGHLKVRSRFVDYPGKFVLHCHILGHEDRGMMQLVEVVDNHTVVRHH
jgi:FtsP/CotA-like multicopper oxidase with cupredoxin domain